MRCSSDGTICCLSHSTRKSTTSVITFPNKKNGMNREVEVKAKFVIETKPAEHVNGKTKHENIRRTVLKQTALAEEKCTTMNARTAIAKTVTQRGHSSGLRTSCKALVVALPVL